MTTAADSIFDRTSPAALREYLEVVRLHARIDIEQAEALALAAVRYYKGAKVDRALLASGQALEARWYASLRAGVPDYAVYNEPYYLSDVWACWIVYSRKYLLGLASPKTRVRGTTIAVADLLANSRSVVDLGCGFGYTTAGLKELFPQARVYGTNLAGTVQFKVASQFGRMRGFAIAPAIKPGTDLVFASEYFEHFQRPIEHLVEVLEVGRPKHLVLANAFAARSIGHFDTYLHHGAAIPGPFMGRAFNQELRRRGYRNLKTNLWNNRPAIWSRLA